LGGGHLRERNALKRATFISPPLERGIFGKEGRIIVKGKSAAITILIYEVRFLLEGLKYLRTLYETVNVVTRAEGKRW